MSQVGVLVWATCGYAAFLLLAAYGLDVMAERAARHTTRWSTGSFTYHEDHDAWMCPQDQWLWPQSFDPQNRVTRYRASPTVCNSCPVKATCTTSDDGREVARSIDPWPHSESGRFHRGMACALTVLALVLPVLSMVGRSALETLVLGAAATLVGLGSWPLWSHLRHAPAGFPDHVPARPSDGPVSTAAELTRTEERDRFATRWWGVDTPTPEQTRRPGWSRINRS